MKVICSRSKGREEGEKKRYKIKHPHLHLQLQIVEIGTTENFRDNRTDTNLFYDFRFTIQINAVAILK